MQRARQLQLADLAFGASAGTILVVGFLRVFYFEKGSSYYFHSVPFIAKLTLFVIVSLLSIYPTVEFLSWRKHVKAGPSTGDPRAQAALHWCTDSLGIDRSGIDNSLRGTDGKRSWLLWVTRTT